MKTEPQQELREEFTSRLSIQLYFTLIILVEIIATVVIAVGAAWLLQAELAKLAQLPLLLWIILFSAAVGSVFAFVVNRIILRPIKKLSRSMQSVAAGDFKTEIDTNSRIHEIQDCYRSFNLMTRELAATEILQTDFVSNVSHEFKTPINAIEGYATLLQDRSMDQQQREEYTERILLNTRRLSELVGNILLLSKVDSQAITAKAVTFRLDEQIRQAVLLLENRWTKKEIDFDIDLESVSYTGGESFLRHVWSNLIDNAVKFSPQGGLVILRLKKNEGSVVFQISDAGPGVAPEDRRHIFDRFYQSDSSHKAEGNGLGLALVRSIVELEGGTVAVDDGETGGCRFTVILPGD